MLVNPCALRIPSGGLEAWANWANNFKQYMGLRISRWPMLLEAAEKLKGRLVTALDEAQWNKEMRLGGIQNWKSTLNMYLEQHTKGSIKSEIVETCGVSRVLDAWRIMADRGSSQRPEHLHAKLSKIISPKKAVAIKDVERAIAEWERDIEVYRLSKPDYTMEADQQLMLLMQLCPVNLQAYLRMQKDCLTDYDKLKMAIHDWLGFPENQQRTCKIAALEQIIDNVEGQKEDGEQEVEVDEATADKCNEIDSSGYLLALVKKEILKTK